jgi:HSP20 family protein
MTLVKFKRENGTNENNRSTQSSMPSLNTEWSSVWPFNTLGRPFFGRDLIQDFLDDNMGISSASIGTTLPAVNISETDNELVIEVAAPGMNKKDFKVEINDNQLHIGYQKEGKSENNDNNHWRREFNFESFERNFTLPAMVESDKIAATYNDGILRIAVPKKEEARRKPAKAIEIK